MNDYLIEIGTEELPPTSLKKLSDAFSKSIRSALNDAELSFKGFKAYATPRRLAVLVEALDSQTPHKEVKVWGPPAKIAFDADGNPTKAAEAFAKKNGATVKDLTKENDGKADKLVFLQQAGGEKTQSLIGSFVNDALSQLPIAKRMRWGSSREEFVRPVQWLVMLKDNEILNETILGLKASNITHGHRFHCDEILKISKPNDYEALLEKQGHVIADYDKRKHLIKEQVEKAATDIGGHAVISDDLLEEVTGLVELPTALAGKFDDDFLKVPSEALVSSMKEHQKYFHIVNSSDKLLPYFVTVSNIKSTDPAQVIDGNERVIRPRLADAAFFFETDKKTSLSSKAEKLKTVVFQAKLGTVYEKTQRVAKLSEYICSALGFSANNVKRAAELSKADLVSNMVTEFPSMQGIAGYHYAENDGENKDVAKAILEQYKPRFSGDTLPQSQDGSILALADRLDTIVGIFGIGQIPSGSKDPFALRRSSLGALRIIVEKEYDLDLQDILKFSANLFSDLPKANDVVNQVQEYMIERFRSWFEDANIKAEIFQSVSSRKLSKPLDINNRVLAVAEFAKREEAISLAAANKRVSNILAKLDSPVSDNFEDKFLLEDAEKNLSNALLAIKEKTAPLFENNDYTKALSELAQLKDVVDQFFADVMVMTDDLDVRNNRLGLLQSLRNLFLRVADISYLDVKK